MDISLAAWSINKRFRAETDPLSLLDFPQVSVEEFGIHMIEPVSSFFEYDGDDQGTSPFKAGYLEELRKRADDLGVRILNVAVDGHGDLSSLDEGERKKAVQNHLKWFDACQVLGCNAFRANSGGGWREEPTEEKVLQCLKSFGELTEHAEKAGVRLMMENHGGISIRPDNIVRVMREVNSDYCRVLADFLNWSPNDDFLANLQMVAPYTWAVHVKLKNFDALGECVDIDVPRAFGILKEVGFQAPFGIEYGSGEDSDHDGVLKSKVVIERHGY